MFKNSCIAMLLLAAGTPFFEIPSVHAQVSMKWKFKQGDTFFVEESAKTKQNVSVMGMDVKINIENRRVSKFTVKEAGDQGVVLEQVMLLWQTQQDVGGLGEAADKLNNVAKGAKFQVFMKPNGEITKLEGVETFLKKIEKEFPGDEGKAVRAVLNKEVLKSNLDMTFSVLPEKAVKQGDKWNKTVKVSAGPLGYFEFSNEYTLEGQDAGKEKVALKGNFKYLPPSKEDGKDFPFQITKADLKSPEGAKGTLIFDSAKGRIDRMELTVPISGSMTMELAGNAIDLTTEAVETRVIRLHAKNPVADDL